MPLLDSLLVDTQMSDDARLASLLSTFNGAQHDRVDLIPADG